MKIQCTSELHAPYQSHIVIPFAEGKIFSANLIARVDRKPVQPVIAATWPDGSIKWLHLYTELVKDIELEFIKEPIEYEPLQTNVTIDPVTGNISLADHFAEACSFLVDEQLQEWSFKGTVTLIESGPVVIIYKLDGFLGPFCRQVTYITISAHYIKFSHAVIFTENMNNYSVHQLGYNFNNGQNIRLTSLDMEQKFPNHVDLEKQIFYQWPGISKHYNIYDTEPEHIYKFKYLYDGPLITTRMPNEYLAAWPGCATAGRMANMQGIALHNDFAVMIDYKYKGEEVMYQTNPIGIVVDTATKVFGSIVPFDKTDQIDLLVYNVLTGCDQSCQRFMDYGLFIFGNLHNDEYPNDHRPALENVWANLTHQNCSQAWQHVFRSATHIKITRRITDYYASICQNHITGEFYDDKGILPWGGNSSLLDTYTNPSGLLYSWLIDANYWHRDAYDLWNINVHRRLRDWGSDSDVNATLITLYEYTHDKTLIPYIENMGTKPLAYYDYRDDNAQFNQRILDLSINNVDIGINLIAFDITKDISFLAKLRQILPRVKRSIAFFSGIDLWNYYNFKDINFCYQWPRLKYALEVAGINAFTYTWDEPGNYANAVCKYDNMDDIANCATEIFVEAESHLLITLDTIGNAPTSFTVFNPEEQIIFHIPRLKFANKRIRSSTWQVDREEYKLAVTPGVYRLAIASNEIAVCGKLTDLPEVQRLNNEQSYLIKISQMYLLKLSSATLIFEAFGKSSPVMVGGKWMRPEQRLVYTLYENISQLNIHCEGDSYVRMTIDSTVKYPLLMGKSKEDLTALKGHFLALIDREELVNASNMQTN